MCDRFIGSSRPGRLASCCCSVDQQGQPTPAWTPPAPPQNKDSLSSRQQACFIDSHVGPQTANEGQQKKRQNQNKSTPPCWRRRICPLNAQTNKWHSAPSPPTHPHLSEHWAFVCRTWQCAMHADSLQHNTRCHRVGSPLYCIQLLLKRGGVPSQTTPPPPVSS